MEIGQGKEIAPGGLQANVSLEEFTVLRQFIAAVLDLVGPVLELEEQGKPVDFAALGGAVTRLFDDEEGEADAPAAAAHAAHAHAPKKPKKKTYPCWMRGPGREDEGDCHPVKAYSRVDAWRKCRDLADDRHADPAPVIPKVGRCP